MTTYHDKIAHNVDAGHFHAVSVEPELRFHAMNIWTQCRKCNRFDGGNGSGYSTILSHVLPSEVFNYILDLPHIYRGLKLMRHEKEHALVMVNQWIKKLKAEDKKGRTIAERIELRKKINHELNLYP